MAGEEETLLLHLLFCHLEKVIPENKNVLEAGVLLYAPDDSVCVCLTRRGTVCVALPLPKEEMSQISHKKDRWRSFLYGILPYKMPPDHLNTVVGRQKNFFVEFGSGDLLISEEERDPHTSLPLQNIPGGGLRSQKKACLACLYTRRVQKEPHLQRFYASERKMLSVRLFKTLL